MNKRQSWLVVLGILLFCGSVLCGKAFAAEVLPSSKAVVNDYPYLPYAVNGPVLQLPKTWRYQQEDNPEYSRPDFDDAKWPTIEVGQPKPGGEWRWYRVAFDLPRELENRDLLLDLGRVSVYDEVFVNGVQVGHFGNPPPYFLHGATNVWRKYPIPAQRFRAGRNVLAIRVHIGHRGGLYQGPYTLQALANNSIVGKMALKTGGVHALETLLTEATHLNTFSPGGNLLVGPELLQLFGSTTGGVLTARIVDGEKRVVARDEIALSLNEMEWTRPLFQFKAPEKVGAYRCLLSYEAGGQTLWSQELPFTVAAGADLVFAPKVDASLAQLENAALPIRVDSAAVGHFGPRDLTPDLKLVDNVESTDARSGMAFSIQTLKRTGGPRLFLSNVRPVPVDADKVGRLHLAAGHNFDGIPDAWIYGTIRPNRAGATEKLEVQSTSWAKRTYRYEYANNDWMEYSVSAVSPAWRANSNTQKLRVFDEIRRHGVGLPTHLAYESNGQVKVVDAETGVRGRDMSANWILAWFNGGENWNEFDTPYLFVLEKRPDLVETYGNAALFFNNANGVGTVQGMPLYGVTLQSLNETASWAKGLPTEVVERSRYWSRVLVNAPDEVTRTARVDYAADQLTVRDEFTYQNIQDDWKTQGLKIAPLSTVLPLAASSGNLDIAVSKPTTDLEMATLQGPLLAVEEADKVVFRVNGVLRYIREVRAVQQAEDDPQARQVREELNRIVAEGLESELKTHPWKSTISGGDLMPGRQRVTFTNLVLTLPYLEPALRSEVEKEIRAEVEKYFLYASTPDAELAPKLKPELRERPLVSTITNPVTGLQLGVAASSARFGIDQTYFTSLNIYTAWLYADTFNRYEWARENYPLLQQYFNTARNSHDWGIGVSWDTFSGFRVGNGLQESGGIHAGMIGMARIARQLGDSTTADAAAYYAVMQVVGMQGQLAASEYLKQRRPWLASHSKQNDIEQVQKVRSYYFAEFNEFAGLSQSIIGTGNTASSPGGYIESPLPEVMRLYQEIWPEYTNEFYDPKYDEIIKIDRRLDDRLSLDAFVYQTTRYPQSIQEIFDMRRKLEMGWWDKLPDYRAYLDARGKIGQRKLW